MKSSRRKFLELGGLTGAAMLTGLSSCINKGENAEKIKVKDVTKNAVSKNHTQRFNMSGYAAPKLDKVHIGYVGLGNRGTPAVKTITNLEGVEVTALCDINEDRVERSQKILTDCGIKRAKSYSGNKEVWKSMCENPDIDLIYVTTPWAWHTPMAVYAMECGKHVVTEVPAAKTIDECWQLVETSEKTHKHMMMLENCCYGFFELLTLNMARDGYFGDIVHVAGGYIHDLLEGNFSKTKYSEMWRLKENQERNGNLYPTHGLGPLCQVLNINRGDKMEYLSSMSSDDFSMGKMASELAAKDDYYKPYNTNSYRGNMNTSFIRTHNGKTMLIEHDVSSHRPYSRIHQITGTEGMALEYPLPSRIAKGDHWMDDKEMKELEGKYTPPIIKKIGALAKEAGGHGGMDFILAWRLIDLLRNGLPLDQNVYDAALWSSISSLSEWSVANRSNSIDVPDFTCGSWKSNVPVDLSLSEGGNTKIKLSDKKQE